jgi:hypothetical protein
MMNFTHSGGSGLRSSGMVRLGWKRSAFALLLLPGLAAAAVAPAAPKVVTAHVEVRHGEKAPESVLGKLVSWDDTSLTLHVKDADRELKWEDLTGISAYALRSTLIDRKDPEAWIKLGTLAWGLNDSRDARVALAQALKLDPKLKADVEAIEASGAGILLEAQAPELMHDAKPDADDGQDGDVSVTKGKIKYRKTTPAQAKEALAKSRADSKKICDEFKLDLKEIETDHFIVFTDWPASSYPFIEKNLEAAKTCVSKQFELLPTDNIFVGKLAVYMFNTHGDFLKFGVEVDHLPPGATTVEGYYATGGGLAPHLVMSKPDFGVGHQQEVNWAYVLTHEFTHAFVARYRSTRHLPTWINEGIAEVIASSQFPKDVKGIAREVAASNYPLSRLFNERAGMQSGEMYPVMRTLTEVLILKDHKKFLAMFDQMKAGAPAAKALKDNYGMTFEDLEKLWRVYIAH